MLVIESMSEVFIMTTTNTGKTNIPTPSPALHDRGFDIKVTTIRVVSVPITWNVAGSPAVRRELGMLCYGNQ